MLQFGVVAVLLVAALHNTKNIMRSAQYAVMRTEHVRTQIVFALQRSSIMLPGILFTRDTTGCGIYQEVLNVHRRCIF